MYIHWLDSLCCPHCHGALSVYGGQVSDSGKLNEGGLACGACSRVFPVSEGIARFVADDDPVTEEESWKRSERRKRDEEAAVYDSMFTGYRNAVECQTILRQLRPKSQDRIVEIGAGTGRITAAYAARVKSILAVDFSYDSLRVIAQRLERSPVDLCLVQADASLLPIRTGSFSKAVSAQVLEHLPGSMERANAIGEFSRILRPGGTLVITVYYYSPEKRLRHRRQPSDRTMKEGSHSDGAIYFYNFGYGELKRLLNGHIKVDRMRGILQERPYLERFGRLGMAIERIVQTTPLSLFAAHMLLARAHRGPVDADRSKRAKALVCE